MILAFAVIMLGPITKWDDKKPDYVYVSDATADSAERCIIDSDGWPAPMVYKQSDRPGITTIIYLHPHGWSLGRIDLITKADGLHVTSWVGPKRILECAPPKNK